MCGIVGIICHNAYQHKSRVKEMIEVIRHRGPDSCGFFSFDDCILGHSRLAIVDINTGQQPMRADNDKIGIVFNGEIYGYKSLKKEINAYSFSTLSDTEVILVLYRKFREKMLEKLPGMFAFSIWDENLKSLFCARDRFGEKPFYYAFGKNNEFIFASEIKAILASNLIRPILNKESLAHYLKKIYIKPNETIYKNIYTLPPAHYLLFREGKLEIKKYWQLPQINEKIDTHDAISELMRLFEKAVEKQLVADVPVGIFLSGGLDSSTVTAVASKFKKNIRTFSFGFSDEKTELPFAKLVAEKYRTNHTEVIEKNYDIAELLLKMHGIFDEPFADSSNIPTYLIAKSASKTIKVVLGGDGSDELLGGYDYWYNDLMYFLEYKDKTAVIYFFIKILINLRKRLKIFDSGNFHHKYRGLELAKGFNTIGAAHEFQNTYFNEAEINKLGLKFFSDDASADTSITGTINDALHTDLTDYLPGDILVKTDRATMASGLELRSPFLDIDFASFCISLPDRLKISMDENKIILRRSYEKYWPEEITKRKKQGFGAPVERWLSLRSVENLLDEYLFKKDRKIYGLLPFDFCKQYFNPLNYKTWILLNLSIWMEKHEFDI